VVSENSLYIQGDYNTVNKVGASVIADAVNLLSNSWNDSKTKGNLPTASNTTYNVAMISGNLNTVTNGQYNGGLENLPRFHENWTGKQATITGSLVNTWTSQFATGTWAIGGDRYTAPNRVWTTTRRSTTSPTCRRSRRWPSRPTTWLSGSRRELGQHARELKLARARP
jgi:hypothetical protein